jgi:hypothetical protein
MNRITKLNEIFKITIAIYLFIPVFISAQDFTENNLENNVRLILSDPTKDVDYLKGYTRSLTTSFGVIMGGALFHRADLKRFPRLDIGLSAAYIKLPSKAKTFAWSGTRVPTFFGTDDPPAGAIRGTNISEYWIPQLQLNLGLFKDFELMFRGNPSYVIDEIGEITLFGVGIKYGLSDLISLPDFDLSLSAQASYHVLRVSNWLNTGTFGMNVQASKDLPFLPLGLYTGVGYEATSMTMSTDEISGVGENAVGDVKLNGENGLRILLGISIHVYYLTFNIDYNISEYDSFGLGAKLVF